MSKGWVVDLTRGCGQVIRKVPGIYPSPGAARIAAKKAGKSHRMAIRPALESDICQCGDRAVLASYCERCYGTLEPR